MISLFAAAVLFAAPSCDRCVEIVRQLEVAADIEHQRTIEDCAGATACLDEAAQARRAWQATMGGELLALRVMLEAGDLEPALFAVNRVQRHLPHAPMLDALKSEVRNALFQHLADDYFEAAEGENAEEAREIEKRMRDLTNSLGLLNRRRSGPRWDPVKFDRYCPSLPPPTSEETS